MKRTILGILALLVAAFILGGCMTQFSTGNGKLAYASLNGDSKGHLSRSQTFMYIIHPDLITFGGKTWETLEHVIEPELSRAGGNAVKNLELRYGFTFVNYLLTMIVPVVSWGTYEVEGDIISVQ
ncbi:MAG: hypothetical protein DRP87_15445 [Spirochaetes bacterium]|nr:MAG: hypothetical protein DRP87_15445 [Spirochaetota bacterium]